MIKMENDIGSICITDEVFTNLAGEAATSCFGVKGMVACAKEGGPWQLLRRESMSKGVRVRNEENGEVSLELHIGVDHGEVSYKLEKSTGIPLKSIDVFVDAIIA